MTAIALTPLDGPLYAEIGGVKGAPRLVFVHGFTQTGRSWMRVAEHFARHYEVMLVDLPGHGGSTNVRADLRRAADLLAMVGGEAHYVGYSLGGRVVLHLALAYPHLARQLVLLSTTAGIADDEERNERIRSDDALASSIEADGVDAFLDRWLSLPMFAGIPAEAADLDDRRRNTAAGLASSLRLAGTGTQTPLWERLPEVGNPTLILAGDRDTKFVALGQQMARRIGVDATFALVHDSGHAVHLERPVQVLTRIEGFLSRGR
jgi:2-succinyl-6-hydroxy-2,4-cyclohexadiene-1-carboxylate synthase